ncbi:VOC family protein [soil metagenome]
MPTLHPHLFFRGQAEEAFNFYKSVFGGDFTGPMHKYKDVPSENVDDAIKDWVMHVSIMVGKNTMLMGADYHTAAGNYNQGNGFSVYIDTDSKEQADEYFNGLAAGGRVSMPQEDTFWGSYFGMLTDKFGVNWMIAYDAKKE